MSKKDEIKKNAGSSEDKLKKAAETVSDAAKEAAEDVKEAAEDTDNTLVSAKEALAEIAAEEQSAKEDTGDSKEDKKKKKSRRTPEAEKERALNRVKRLKKLKYGSLATVITLVVIAIVVMVNVICNVLDKRYNLNIDLTSTGLYELDEQTISYLHQIKDDIEIAVMADEAYFQEDARLKVVSETLTRFRTESGNRIDVKYLDLTKNPDVVREYSQNYDGELSQGDVVIKNGELVRVLSLYGDLVSVQNSIDYNTYQQVQNISFKGEQALISALMGVTDLHPVKVAVINKMNGTAAFNQYDQFSFQRMTELLEKNNYQITEIDIATDELSPEDYDLAILCAPSIDLTEAQITKLTDYLNNNNKYGKNMIYFGSPYQQGQLEHVEEFLEVWGVKIGAALVCEGDQKSAQVVNTAISQMPIPSVPVLKTTDNALNANVVQTKLPLVGALCSPVEALFESNAGRTVAPLLTSSDTCYLQPLQSEGDFDKDKAERASFVLAAVSESNFYEGNEQMTSRLVTFGSAFFLDYLVAGNNAGSYANAGYFVSVVNTLCGKGDVFTVEEKSLDAATFTITESQAKAIRNITVLVIPITVALLGIVVYVRRKNK